MSAVATDHLIRPHGGELVDRTGSAPEDLADLKVVQLTSRELSDLDMLASGALSPLEGFMGQSDYESVLESMRLSNGLPWSLPVCLAVDGPPQGDRVALADESGTPVASSRSRASSTTTRSARPSWPTARPTRSTPASRGSTGRSRCIWPAR